VIDWFRELNPILQALLAGCFTWFVTAVGAALVFVTTSISRRLLDAMLGFAAGVMIAASVWSLIIPAIERSEELELPAWLPVTIGFLLGAFFLLVFDKLLPHLHPDEPAQAAEGLHTAWQRTTLLIMAITLHNVPEGLAVGVAFGAAAELAGAEGEALLASATTLAIGIGLQNFPEGIAVSVPLRGAGLSRTRSFTYGQLSASVEPLAAVLGAALTLLIAPALPYALGFAAGAMIFVVVEELIPGSHGNAHDDWATLATIGGFTVMMILDVALG
jgi:ZIP family zinc transporter